MYMIPTFSPQLTSHSRAWSSGRGSSKTSADNLAVREMSAARSSRENNACEPFGLGSAELLCRNGESKVTRENPEYQAYPEQGGE